MVDKTIVPEGTILEERFKIGREIGRGGMGTVYVGEHTLTGKQLAIKIMGEGVSADSAYKQRFLREAKLMAQMSDAHIASVSAVGVFEDRLYLVMDYVEGRTLQAELRERGKLDELCACSIALQVCEALEHAHSIGIVHRDLKPGNVMLEGQCTASGVKVKLLDFGIAAWLDRDDSGRITQTGEVFGSPYYMSPEQCQGMRLDGRSDLYSLGCIMYEMLAGHTPFSGDSYFAVLSMQMTADAPPIKDISPAMQEVVRRAMAKNSDHRYADAAALREDLRKVLAGEAIARERPGKKQSSPLAAGGKKQRSRWPGVAIIAALMAICSAAIAVHHYYRDHNNEPPSAAVGTESAANYGSEVAQEMEGSGEVVSMKLGGILPVPRLPGHRRAMEAMEARITLPLGDPDRVALLVKATRILREELASANMQKAGNEEHDLMLQRLAFWDGLLIPKVPRNRREELYSEAGEAIGKSVQYEERVGARARLRRIEILAFVNFQYGREMRDLRALKAAEAYYGAVLQALKEREKTADEQQLFRRCLSRLEEIRDRMNNMNKLVNLQMYIKDPKEDEVGQFDRVMFSLGGRTMPLRDLEKVQHRRATFLMSRYRSTIMSTVEKASCLTDARELLRKLLESAEHGDFTPPISDEELALINLRRGICDIDLAGLSEEPGKRERYYRQAVRDVSNSIDVYRKIDPDYRDSFEARWRLGYVHYKYALLSNDRLAYEQARSDFVFALEKLKETGKKQSISPDEERLAERLQKAVELIDRRIGKPEPLWSMPKWPS